MLTETLKFVYGSEALQTPLLKSDLHNAVRNSDGVRQFFEKYQGFELFEANANYPNYLGFNINSIRHITLFDSKNYISSLKPNFPLIMGVAAEISACIATYNARIEALGGMKSLSEEEYSAEAHMQAMSKEMGLLNTTVSSLRSDVKQSNELITQLRDDLKQQKEEFMKEFQRQQNEFMQKMLQIMRTAHKEPDADSGTSTNRSTAMAMTPQPEDASRTYIPSGGFNAEKSSKPSTGNSGGLRIKSTTAIL